MITAHHGGMNEAEEAIVNGQALRILDQEVREAYEEMRISKDELAGIMEHQKMAEEKCSDLEKQIEEHEVDAIKALEQGDTLLAGQVMEKITNIESQLDQTKKESNAYNANADKVRIAINQTKHNLKRLKQQVVAINTSENVQRAQTTAVHKAIEGHL